VKIFKFEVLFGPMENMVALFEGAYLSEKILKW